MGGRIKGPAVQRAVRAAVTDDTGLASLTGHGVGEGAGRARLGGGQRWTLARVATVMARRFHVRFSPAQTWRILHQRGWTVQVPARRAAERDEDAVATWIKETWPQVEQR